MSSTRAKEGTYTFRARRLLSALLVGLVGLPVAAVSALVLNTIPAFANTAPAPTTTSFSYNGSAQTFTVPVGVTSVAVDMAGGQGGSYLGTYDGIGGQGGVVQGTLAVTPGAVLTIVVGGAGADNTGAAGYGGGGSGGTSAGGGGGASSINGAVIAGGGGGGAYGEEGEGYSGGAGGGLTGGNGGGPSQGGTQTAGGTGAFSGSGNGSFEQGGSSSSAGGGGGGYFGGGGGGVNSGTYIGGGGGSSYVGGLATVTANDQGGSSGNGYVTLSYTSPVPPAITSNASASFTQGSAGTFTVTTTGWPNPALSIESGSLPTGVTLVSNGDGTGTISGTPTGVPGAYTFTIQANNGDSPDATQLFTLDVDQSPAITSNASASFTQGSAGTFTVTTTGWPNPALSIESGSLPTGVTLVSNGDGTGTISGTPSSPPGAYTVEIEASNGVSPNATQSFTLNVDSPPSISSADSASFTYGTAGTFTVTATGFPAPTFSLDSGSGPLPTGVTLSLSGVLSGTPTQSGSFPLVIVASNGVSPEAQQDFTLTVTGTAPTITSADGTSFTENAAGTFTVTTTGSPAPALSDGGATLPTGVTFVDNGNGSATLAGTPSVAGAFTFTITATNGFGTPAAQSFTLTVVSTAPVITSVDHAQFTEGAADSFTITSTGTPTPSFSDGSASLPAGVTFVANGNGTVTLSGTATATGSFPFTITATNGVTPDGTQSFTLTVNASSGGGAGGGVSSGGGGGGGGGNPPPVVTPTPTVTPPAGDVPTNLDGSCPSGYETDPFVTGYCMVNPVIPIVTPPAPAPTPVSAPTPTQPSIFVSGLSKMLHVSTSVDESALSESVSKGILDSLNVTTPFTTNGVVTGTMTIAVEKNEIKVHEASKAAKLTKIVIRYVGEVKVNEPDFTMTLTNISGVKLTANGGVKGIASGIAEKVSTVVKKHKGRTLTSKVVHKTDVHFDWSVS